MPHTEIIFKLGLTDIIQRGYICYHTQTFRSQLPSFGPCKWKKQGILSLGIWPGHKLHILEALQLRKKLCSNHCFNRHKLTAKTNRHFSHMVGGMKNLEEQMESLPEEPVRRQANQESQVQYFVLNLKSHNLKECRVWVMTTLWVCGSLHKIQVHDYRPLT